MTFDALLDRLRTKIAPSSPEKQEIIAKLAADAAQLAVRKATGDDVDRELEHLSSQVLNLAREERAILGDELNRWFQGTIASVLAKLFVGA